MRAAIVSAAWHLPYSVRLQDEGADVLVWIGNKVHDTLNTGRGIVPLCGSWEKLLDWCKDGIKQRIPTVMFFDGSGYGDRADEARKAGVLVVGGSGLCDRMEKDRAFGFKMAEEVGMTIPNHEEFSTISAAIKYAERLGDQPTYFKSDRHIDENATYGAKDGYEMVEFLESLREARGNRIKCIIQDTIEGTAISTEQWFNGHEFVGRPIGIIENKKLLNDNVGPSTGCALNAVWFYEDETSFIADKLNWANLASVLRKHDAPPGIYDANAIITEDGDAFFLEWCARMGYDSEPTCQLLIDDFSDLLWNVASGHGTTSKLSSKLAFSTHIWVPPYPAEHDASVAQDRLKATGKPVYNISTLWGDPFVAYGLQFQNGKYELSSAFGEVGIAALSGAKLSVLNKYCVEYAKSLRPSGFCFRTDGDKTIAHDAKELMKVVPDLHKGLVL